MSIQLYRLLRLPFQIFQYFVGVSGLSDLQSWLYVHACRNLHCMKTVYGLLPLLLLSLDSERFFSFLSKLFSFFFFFSCGCRCLSPISSTFVFRLLCSMDNIYHYTLHSSRVKQVSFLRKTSLKCFTFLSPVRFYLYFFYSLLKFFFLICIYRFSKKKKNTYFTIKMFYLKYYSPSPKFLEWNNWWMAHAVAPKRANKF